MSKAVELWKLAAGEIKDESHSCIETTLLFVGSTNSGKTSLILRFLEKEEAPKPTTGLEYTFGRRSKGPNMIKSIANIWELGGGTLLTELVDLPITKDTISQLSIFIVLDLSKPEVLWTVLERILKQIRHRVDQVISELGNFDQMFISQLRQKSWEKFGDNHPDKDMLDPLPISLVFVGTKYDLFQSFDPEKKKTICKTLRFLAHIHGASLQFYSIKSDALITRGKQLLSHYAFGTSASHTMSMDYTKPLVVPAGSDSLGQIGVPPIPAGELVHISAKKPIDLWKQAFCSAYPQNTVSSLLTDPSKDCKYAELQVDSCRAEKDRELDKYRTSARSSVKSTVKFGAI